MDDPQLERELAALAGEQAETEQPSEAETTTPGEGEEGQAETEIENAEADAEGDAGDNASEADDDGEGEKSEHDSDKDEQPKKKRSGIARLKEQLAAARAEAAALRSRATDSEPTQADVEAEIGKPPEEKDFNGDFLAFESAKSAYQAAKLMVLRDLKKEAKQAATARQTAKAEIVEAHNERLEEFAGKVPDFEKTLKAAGSLKASPVVEDLILDSDKSAHLVYHLAKNPDRLAKLNAMGEREAAREIGRIEARLSLPSPKTATKAPPPKAPLKGGASPMTVDKEIDAYIAKKYG